MSLLNFTQPNIGSAFAQKALDLMFQNCAIMLKNPELCKKTSLIGDLTSGGSSFLGNEVAMPVVGFYYESPNQIEYFRFEYSEYPFMNNKMVSNSFIKQPTTISINGVRPITKENNWVVNYLTSQSVIEMLEGYCEQGGLFKLFTRWGTIDNLALESLSLNSEGDDRSPGTFSFQFKRLLFIKTESKNVISSTLDAISKGWGK